jgi:hypothetical protein
MSRINTRQQNFRRIRKRDTSTEEGATTDPRQHHFIGISQNQPVDLAQFLQSNLLDPATDVSLFLRHVIVVPYFLPRC